MVAPVQEARAHVEEGIAGRCVWMMGLPSVLMGVVGHNGSVPAPVHNTASPVAWFHTS